MIDTNLELKDAGLVASSAAGQVGGSDKILDLGQAKVAGNLILDVTAIEIASNDEIYKISLQGSSSATFADTIEDLASIELGAKEVLDGDQDSTTGRYAVPITNERNGTIFRYVREYCEVAGAVATGINFTARLEK